MWSAHARIPASPIGAGSVRRPAGACWRRLCACWRRLGACFAALFIPAMLFISSMPTSGALPARRAVVLEIDGIIGPAVAGYVVRELKAARPEDTGLVVLRMNTPGGLDT